MLAGRDEGAVQRVRARLKKEGNHAQVSVLRGPDEGVIATLVGDADVGAPLNEQTRDILLPVPAGRD